jgi:phosphoribosylaminoimidazole carboxylase
MKKKMQNAPNAIGIIGGGQLGMLLIKYGLRRLVSSVPIRVLTPSPECAVAAAKFPYVEVIVGSYQSEDDLRRFVSGCRVITWEIEHINVDALERLQAEGYRFVPSIETLRMVQDKAVQKAFFVKQGFQVVDYVLSSDPRRDFWGLSDVQQRVQNHLRSDPVVYKARRSGYDGRGVWVVHQSNKDDPSLDNIDSSFIIERFMHMPEISVIVAKDETTTVAYEPTLMKFHKQESILDICTRPSYLDIEYCQNVAIAMADKLGSPGLFAFEFFYQQQQQEEEAPATQPHCPFGQPKLWLNEMAPRVHNSGHHTINTHTVSQFEMLARILLGVPIETPTFLPGIGGFVMRNMFFNSNNNNESFAEVSNNGCYEVLNHMCVNNAAKGPFVFDYCKGEARPWRKLGHVTHVAATQADAQAEYQWCRVNNVIEFCAKRYAPAALIGIVMGSESDWPVMMEACQTLNMLGVGYEVTVVSAHRTPDRLVQYAKTASERGLCVIIAGAGGAAHLPGMIASFAPPSVPVIGVPIRTAALNGLDSLYSIVQMPPGIPVACMAINGAKNAAIFAASILASTAPPSITAELRSKLVEYRDQTEEIAMRSTCFRNRSIDE